jgi:hypothetical protein
MRGNLGILVICTGIGSFEMSCGAVRDLASRAFETKNRIAIVADRPAAFGLARMYEVLADPNDNERVRVFKNESSAIEWLRTGCA